MASTNNITDVEQANERYAADFGDKGSLPLPPGKKLIILTCMDARIDPAASLGIKEGDAHIIRNAGGRPQDAIRSIVISQRLLGTREVIVFHHTDCGMLTFKQDEATALIAKALPSGPAQVVLQGIAFLPITEGLEQAVKDDVEYIKTNPLVLENTPVSGYIYRVEDGKIVRIV